MTDEFKVEEEVENLILDADVEVKPKKKISKKTSKKNTETVVEEDGKVALWSSANLHQAVWGPLAKGPNIVDKEVAEKWLTHRSVRIATPEEVAAYYNGS